MDRVFSPTRFLAPQANFFKEYSRYTLKKSAPLSKEEGGSATFGGLLVQPLYSVGHQN
jgi:hypothetical protein